MVGEVAVRLEIHGDDFAGKFLKQHRQKRAHHPVPRIHHHRQRLDAAGVFQQIGAVLAGDFLVRHRPLLVGRGERPLVHQLFHLGQAGVVGDGDGVLAAPLAAVVGGRVVAGGDLHAGVGLEIGGGEVEHRRRGHADVDDVHALLGQAPDHRLGERYAGFAHVAADDAGFAAQHLRGGLAYGFEQGGVHLIGIGAAHIIRFENTHCIAPPQGT